MTFPYKLLKWYHINKRDLPWRNTKDAYPIWLSEIILQQTRVVQGLPYYQKFIKKYPTITKLASAQEDEVLKLWQGLGYYSRAINMHLTANKIVDEYNGIFPAEYDKLLELKGVGSYTASAIMSFSFGLPYAVVDGNVIRVLSRVFGVAKSFEIASGKKEFQELASRLIIQDNPSTYNQAIMEFGALQCKSKPDCVSCPMTKICFAYKNKKVNDLPVKSRKIKKKSRYLHFFIIKKDKSIYVRKENSGIWNGLYLFPYIEYLSEYTNKEVINSKLFSECFRNNFEITSISELYTHVLTHQKILAKFWIVKSETFYNSKYLKIGFDKLLDFPVPKLIEKYLNNLFIK